MEKKWNGVEFKIVGKMKTGWVDETTPFTYRGKEYYINKIQYGPDKDLMYSISEKGIFGSSMDIDKMTSQYISLFSYDMMGMKTKNKMALKEMIFGLDAVLKGVREENGIIIK